MMDFALAADPFSVLTIVVAPAVLTNASTVLALGTNNRLARVADRTHAVSGQLSKLQPADRDYANLAVQLPVFETRAQLLLRALRCFYLALGLFASSALVAVTGSIAGFSFGRPAFQIAATIGIIFGTCAVASLVTGCIQMIRENQLAVEGIAWEAKAHTG